MTTEQAKRLNQFFVETFNHILLSEEQYLRMHCAADISVRELHVLEAVNALSEKESPEIAGDPHNGNNTMANIARFLHVSPGSLTTAVNTLVNKGYLSRSYTQKDRRVVFIELTEAGRKAHQIHMDFHDRMANAIGEKLSPAEMEVLLRALDNLSNFMESPT